MQPITHLPVEAATALFNTTKSTYCRVSPVQCPVKAYSLLFWGSHLYLWVRMFFPAMNLINKDS